MADATQNPALPNYCPRCQAPLDLEGRCVMRSSVYRCPGIRIEHLEPRSAIFRFSQNRPSRSRIPVASPTSSQPIPEPPSEAPADEVEQALDRLAPKSSAVFPTSTSYRVLATTLTGQPPKKPNSG